VINGVEFIPSSTDTYTVTGTDGNGCQDTDQITVTVNPVPVAVINTTDPLEYCEGETISTLLHASPSAWYILPVDKGWHKHFGSPRKFLHRK